MSLQLSIRGKLSAFDISNEIIATSSPGCITFYNLNAYGNPYHVIHYEQPQQIRQLKFQLDSMNCNNILCALRGPSISLWDPQRKLRPLLDFIDHSNGNSASWIVDFDWSINNTYLLASSDDSGCIKVWDIRSQPKSCVHNLIYPNATGNDRNLMRDVSWCPHESNFLSFISNDKSQCIWDIRSTSSNPIINEIKFESTIVSSQWSHESSQRSLVIATDYQNIEWWDIAANNSSYDRESCIEFIDMDSSSIFLVTPLGKGVVVSQFQRENRSTSITLYGYARDDIQYDAKLILAICPEKILGMKWGLPGRLLGPLHNGLELLLLTESGIIHPIRISIESVHKYCGGVAVAMTSKSKPIDVIPSAGLNVDIKTTKELSPKFLISDMQSSLDESIRFGNIYSEKKLPGSTSHENPTLSNESFLDKLKNEILLIQNKISQNILTNLHIHRLDQYARQLTLEMQWPNILSTSTLSSISEYSSRGPNNSVTLIIFFPLQLSVSNLPTFTVRTSPGSMLFKDSLNLNKLVNELNLITKNALSRGRFQNRSSSSISAISSNTSQETEFVSDCVETFRIRVIQSWENLKRNHNEDTMATTIVPTIDNIPKESQIQYLSQQDDIIDLSIVEMNHTFKNDDIGDISNHESMVNKDSNIIDPLAYRIPCPATSGGFFSARGLFIIFGGAELCISIASKQSLNENLGNLGNLGSISRGLTIQTTNSLDDTIDYAPDSSLEVIRFPERNFSTISTTTSRLAQQSPQTVPMSGMNSLSPMKPLTTIIANGTNINANTSNIMKVVENIEIREKRAYLRTYATLLLQQRQQLQEFINIKSSESEISNPHHSENLTIGRESRSSSIQQISRQQSLSPEPANLVTKSISNDDEIFDDNNFTRTNRNHSSSIGSSSSQGTHTNTFKSISMPRVGMATMTKNSKSPMKKGLVSSQDESYQVHTNNLLVFNDYVSPYPLRVVVFEMLYLLEQRLAHNYVYGPIPLKIDNICNDNESHISLELIQKRIEACRINTFVTRKLEASLSTQQIWKLLETCLQVLPLPRHNGGLVNWDESVLGRSLLKRLIFYLLDSGEYVTLATCICVLGGSLQVLELLEPNVDISDKKSQELLQRLNDVLVRMAESTYQWSALPQSVKVKKFIYSPEPNKEEIQLQVNNDLRSIELQTHDCQLNCSRCSTLATFKDGKMRDKMAGKDGTMWCTSCKFYPLICGICELPCRKANYSCKLCGHGGCISHMNQWFEKFMDCPIGCGCRCSESRLLDLSFHQRDNSFESITFQETDLYMGSLDENDVLQIDNETDSDDDINGESDESESDESDNSSILLYS